MSLYLELRSNAQTLSNATGIIGISPEGRPALLTNWHVLSGRDHNTRDPLDTMGRLPDEVVITHNEAFHNQNADQPEQVGWVQRTEPLNGDHGALWRMHPTYGSDIDVGALPLTQLDGVKLRPYLGPGAPEWPNVNIGPSDRISVIGFPFRLTAGGPASRIGEWGALAIWATGFVASEPQVDHCNLPLFLIDCRARRGQSGSPVIGFGSLITRPGLKQFLIGGSATRFLGLYSGRVNKESDLGRVWKASGLSDILATLDS